MTGIKTRCTACRGAKKILGMGCMLKDCEECGGKGHVITDTKPIELHKECVSHEETNIVPTVKTLEKIRRKYQNKTVSKTPNNGLLDGTKRF